MKRLIVCTTILFTGCGTPTLAPPPPLDSEKLRELWAQPQVAPDETARRMVESLRELLKDPEGARVRRMLYYPAQKALCGEINAKAPAGGFVGYSPFLIEQADGKTRIYWTTETMYRRELGLARGMPDFATMNRIYNRCTALSRSSDKAVRLKDQNSGIE